MMKSRVSAAKCAGLGLLVGILAACPFDNTLREYLHRYFWYPFTRHVRAIEKPNVRRVAEAFAGMGSAGDQTPLQRLRDSYQQVSKMAPYPSRRFSPDLFVELRKDLAAAKADASLRGRDLEEVELIDAKIDMMEGKPETPELLERAKTKLTAFLRKARTPEYRSEARGWLAHVHFVLGNQTAAGKIYLDELNRNGSNISREAVLASLQMTYGHDGGEELRKHLSEYFDTPEHAAFAIGLATNPRKDEDPGVGATYEKIKTLLNQHPELLRSNAGANSLALLGMRTALRLGDPAKVREIAREVPEGATVRTDPEFDWMLAGSNFLTGEFAAAEEPLLSLFRSKRATMQQKAAAAYGLCGVYFKTGNALEQLRYAIWLRDAVRRGGSDYEYPNTVSDVPLYFAASGWDLNLLLEFQAPIEALQTFIEENPKEREIRIVKYALAVRLARENRYAESAAVYESIGVGYRVARMRKLDGLYTTMTSASVEEEARLEAKFQFAAFLASNQEKIYFNDLIWDGLQSYVFQADTETRMTRDERAALTAGERKLKDEQEERWRAYVLLREVARDAGNASKLGRKAATLAIQSLRKISYRFGRADEIRNADIELSKWLRDPARRVHNPQ